MRVLFSYGGNFFKARSGRTSNKPSICLSWRTLGLLPSLARRLNELLKEAGGEWKKSDDNYRCLSLHKDEEQGKEALSLTWKVVSNDVAIENNNVVYKIFDNCQRQIWRKLYMWLTNETTAPWLKEFNVSQEILFEKSDDNSNIWVVQSIEIITSSIIASSSMKRTGLTA